MDYGVNDDYLDDDDDGIMYSTQNYCSDSDDEKNISAFCQKKSSKRAICKQDDENSDEEDEFEKEMAAELDATIKKLTSPAGSSQIDEKKKPDGDAYYDNIYFDSDESNSDDEVIPAGRRKAKHKVLTDDQLFYDPLMDDEDQAWVDNKRRKYQVKRSLASKGKNRAQPLPHSDAVLSCPACFTTLCLDCQRHEIYKSQYRAMFVFNCKVDKSEILRFALKEDKKKFKKGKKKKTDTNEAENSSAVTESELAVSEDNPRSPNEISMAGASSGVASNDAYYPVTCTICNTKVAVMDNGEVYHFFNALTSY